MWASLVIRSQENGLQFRKDEILTVNPRNWDNRTDETIMYAGEPIELTSVEFVANQGIPAQRLKTEVIDIN